VPGAVALAEGMTTTLPSQVVGGAKLKSRADVQLLNRLGAAFSDVVVATVYASADGVLDGSDVQMAAMTRRLKIAAGKSKTLRVKLTSAPAMPAGTFQLLAKIDRKNSGGSDVVATAGTFTLSEAAVQLQATAPIVASPILTRGRNARVKIGVSNVGSFPSTGLEQVVLYVRRRNPGAPSGPESLVQLAGTKLKARLAPGRTATLSLKFTVPASLAVGNYDLISAVEIGSGAALIDDAAPSIVVNVV
jgi:hypothetical protein